MRGILFLQNTLAPLPLHVILYNYTEYSSIHTHQDVLHHHIVSYLTVVLLAFFKTSANMAASMTS